MSRKILEHHIKGLNMTPEELEALTPEERWRIEHAKVYEQHRGHDSMHAEMVLIFIVVLIIAQIVLVEWKRRHHKSYLLVTLLTMWLLPMGLSMHNKYWRFIFIWLLFSCISGLVMVKAVQKPIQQTTPRLVYKWFLFIYKLSCAVGLVGYVIMMMTFLGVNLIFDSKPHKWMDCAILLVFYSMYYGVLGRDLSEICADKMAAHVGYYTEEGIPTRHLEPGVCAVCGNKLLVSENEEGVIENTFKLSCQHVFHEFCIRGWCIVGKKQTCPYCKEKVDLKKMFCNPWDRPHILYGHFLDWIRWLAAWQPLIMFLVQGINWMLGLE
ncbi:RING finger protein 121 [Thrips palmi]|uniref:RING finger protein 121 n=1 Tax=Thrips palmi TaxID=161013 RepID=A0A6P8Z7U0_THRPL|nr:RING finger protein 121 [Thrips palmi]